MPYRRVFQSGLWVLAASVLLGACAGVPTRGAPGRYEQSFDSATNSCRQNPTLCTRMAGEELVVPQATQRLAEVGASATVVAMALDGDLRTRIEQALKECAEYARSQVLLDQLKGRAPTSDECNEPVPGRNVTLAMFLGEEMHKLALQCAGDRLREVCPGGFSLEQRYRYDPRMGKTTLVSAEEAQALLQQWRGGELKGTLVPDVVIHSGHPLRAKVVYDFKFPCASGREPASWSKYPKGHPYQHFTQKDMYQRILGVEAWRVAPWWGVLP
jgi:hypothetical protein